jgi:hypothetical protein
MAFELVLKRYFLDKILVKDIYNDTHLCRVINIYLDKFFFNFFLQNNILPVCGKLYHLSCL